MQIADFGIYRKLMAARPVSIFFHSLILMLALILTAGFINTVLPSFDTPKGLGDVSVKFQYFSEHKDDYDILFLGPSTTYHGIIPHVFDELVTANGNQVKSFNLGIPGANVAEMDFYLQKVLALKPAKLKWIFLDCIFDVFNQDEDPSATINVYWHTPLKTLENFRLMTESKRSLPVKIKAFYTNFLSFLYRWFAIGDFSNLLQQRAEVLVNGVSKDKLLQEAGYYAIDWMDNGEKRRDFFLSNQAEYYQQRLEKEKLAKAKTGVLQPDNTLAYSDTSYAMTITKKLVSKIYEQEKITKTKIEPIFLISPALDTDIDNSAIMNAFALKNIPTLFAFNNPNTFAKLYEISSRIDDIHLNHQGSQDYTRALADKFSQYLKLSQQEEYNQSLVSKTPI